MIRPPPRSPLSPYTPPSPSAAAVTVTKHPTVTTVSCNPPAFAAGASTSCTATVTDSVATPPFATGTVNFFADAATTTASASIRTAHVRTPATANCRTTTTACTHNIVATYQGDATHES